MQSTQLLISSGRLLHAVWVSDIKYITMDEGYAVIHTIDNKSIVSSRNLKEVDEVLPNEGFIRVNHGTIVNRNHILHVLNRNANIITMCDQEEIQISARKKKSFYDSFVRL